VSNEKKVVVVVESAVKAKTIEKYLGSDFTVLPTYGHVRDLAARAGSVRPDDEYAMVWEVPEAAQPHVAKIKNALKGYVLFILLVILIFIC
jgi:DNA topoisomerase IA